MAFAELGENLSANEQIQTMKNDNDLKAGSFIAEAEVVKRAYDDKEAASKIYRSGFSQYPNDFFLLTHYSCHLGSPNLATSQEVIRVNEGYFPTKSIGSGTIFMANKGVSNIR